MEDDSGPSSIGRERNLIDKREAVLARTYPESNLNNENVLYDDSDADSESLQSSKKRSRRSRKVKTSRRSNVDASLTTPLNFRQLFAAAGVPGKDNSESEATFSGDTINRNGSAKSLSLVTGNSSPGISKGRIGRISQSVEYGPRQATILGMDKFSLLKEITEAPGDNRSESPYDE